jgi:hypothetical protein
VSGFPLARNPLQIDLLWLAGPAGAVRAIRDPATGSCYAWHAAAGRHADAALLLNLTFSTRQELQRHSFVIGAEQIVEIEAEDLEGVIRAIAGDL